MRQQDRTDQKSPARGDRRILRTVLALRYRPRFANIEHHYNSLEDCLGEMLLGRDAVLIPDPGLTGRVKKKLDRLDKVFGKKVDAVWA